MKVTDSMTAVITHAAAEHRKTPIDDRVDRAQELGLFLRARRESLDPRRMGLPRYGRTRTPGLRREEVAQLANIGITWYTKLEQGRPIRVSPKCCRLSHRHYSAPRRKPAICSRWLAWPARLRLFPVKSAA